MVKARIGGFSFIPFDKAIISTTLNKAEVSALLYEVVERGSVFKIAFKSKPENKVFVGRVNESNFKIWRWISHRNSFLPCIQGKIERRKDQATGAQVTLHMRLFWFSIVFCVLFFGTLSFFLQMHLEAIIEDSDWGNLSYKLVLAALGSYIFVTGAFSYEATKARKIIVELLKGEEI